MAVFAVVTGMLAWWLSGRSLRRIRLVTHLARAAADGDLDTRLGLPGPDDEIKELGDTFDTMLSRLDHALTQRERFIANASHELRTPIAATRIALEAPLAQGRFPAEVIPDVTRALSANERSASLIAALLQLAKTDLRAADAVPVDLAAVTEGALDGYADRMADRSIRLLAHLEPAVVDGDETLLIQAVDNLLDNATRHATEGGMLTVSTSAQDGTAAVVVENDGAVFTADEAARLVEPFHRGRLPRTDTGGHGLGLAIVHAIAVSHQGRLDVRPGPRTGLTVTFSMPCDRE